MLYFILFGLRKSSLSPCEMVSMAATSASIYSAHALLVRPPTPRTIARMSYHFIPKWSFSKMGFSPLKLQSTVSARKLVIRAARTESKGVSLGFRAPEFQVFIHYFVYLWINFFFKYGRKIWNWIFVLLILGFGWTALASRASYR